MASKKVDKAPRCEAQTKRGVRCTRLAKEGARCGHHLHGRVLVASDVLSVSSPDSPDDEDMLPFGGRDPSKREDGPACIAWVSRECLARRLDPQTAHVIIGGIKAVMRATDLGGGRKHPPIRFETVRTREDAERVIAASDERAAM